MNKWLGLFLVSLLAVSAPAFAADETLLLVPIGIGLTLGLAVLGGGFAQGKAVASALESIGRNPSASGSILVQMLIGLAFIESLVILAFAVSYLLLGKI